MSKKPGKIPKPPETEKTEETEILENEIEETEEVEETEDESEEVVLPKPKKVVSRKPFNPIDFKPVIEKLDSIDRKLTKEPAAEPQAPPKQQRQYRIGDEYYQESES